MSLRVPAGVYVDGVAMGGRFVSPSSLVELLERAEGDGAERLLALIYEELDTSVDEQLAVERKFDDDPKRFAEQRDAAEQHRQQWETIASQADSLLRDEEEDFALEWEVGFEYEASASHHSDVDVNVRIRREDAQPMSQSEATTVLRKFREEVARTGHGVIPKGYEMAAINWRRPHQSSAFRGNGHKHDLLNFANPMYTNWDNEGAWDVNPYGPVRLGSVKQ